MRIGNVEVKGNVFLAPMAGTTNIPFRVVCNENGAALVYAEMVSTEGLVHNNLKTKKMIEVSPLEHPITLQIFGFNVDSFVTAAKIVEEFSECDIIDINMGCPAPKVAVRSQAGANLLKYPDKVGEKNIKRENKMSNDLKREFSEQELIRRDKYKNLVSIKKDPFIETKFERNNNTNNLKDKYNDFSKEELEKKDKEVILIAGRIRLFREAGSKAIFANIQDQFGLIQIYVREDEIGTENFSFFKDLDLGDIVGIEGLMMKTQHGELTVRVKKYVLLSKALKPLPDKHSGLVDIEEKYRRRYVDLIMNQDVKDTFIKRTKIIRAIQNMLDSQGFMEVETPILQQIQGGAAAKPFVTHYNALDNDFYLRIATELHLKRLIVGGFEGVYEIGRLFRNEGTSTRHNPEFTSMECYAAYKDLDYLMDIVQKVILNACLAVNPTKFVEDKIVEPTFIIGHPKEISPLSKTNKDDPRFTDRYELFIIGREYCNAFAELNNPIDQYDRFLDQIKEADNGNDEATEMDLDFVEALEYGLPPTGGFGLGIDRLVMLLTNSESIKDVLLFPQMKPRS
ncbi:hypothetical protein FQR65_LT17607 [Abscondita terminalis]|nr:hypothetical protein FQR65_LT17607 [Abscondita terminalis]